MTHLIITLVILGLLSIDPIGIAAIIIILTQKKPLSRSFIFLAGSFVALLLVGMVLAFGVGRELLHFDHGHRWIKPSVDLTAGVLLVMVSVVLYIRFKQGKEFTKLSNNLMEKLKLSNFRLFSLGAAIVTFQSVADVVFVVAMVKTGHMHIAVWKITISVIAYSISALVLQFIAILVFYLSPHNHRLKTLDKISSLLDRYAAQLLIEISLMLGVAFLFLGYLALNFSH
jgi:hypothetical protein